MPAIKVTAAKGLFQTGGTTAVPNGSLSGDLKVVSAVSANTTLTAADSGKIIELDADAPYTITLPSAGSAKGFYARFVLVDAGSNDVKITTGVANGIQGHTSDPTTGINTVDHHLIKFVASTAIVGDFVELYSNGTRYIVHGASGATDGLAGAAS